MDDKNTIKNEIERFCERHGMSPSGFGRWALNNPNFVSDLSNEKFSPKTKTVAKVRQLMKNYKPKTGGRNGKAIL